jgi:hypothetical protein
MRIKRFAATATICAAMISALLTTGVANAAPQDKPAGKYCAVLLGSEVDSTGSNVVIGEECSNSSAEAAHQKLVGKGATASASTLLMRWYEHSYYGGTTTAIYGSYGPCDAAGYRVNLSDWWRYRISSIKGNFTCDWAALTANDGLSTGKIILPQAGLGMYNDNVRTIQVYNG